jgi:hypothetical protein
VSRSSGAGGRRKRHRPVCRPSRIARGEMLERSNGAGAIGKGHGPLFKAVSSQLAER